MTATVIARLAKIYYEQPKRKKKNVSIICGQNNDDELN